MRSWQTDFTFFHKEVEIGFVPPIQDFMNIHPTETLFVVWNCAWIIGWIERISLTTEWLTTVNNHCLQSSSCRSECICRYCLSGWIEPFLKVFGDDDCSSSYNRGRHGSAWLGYNSAGGFIRPTGSCWVNWHPRSHDVRLDSLIGGRSLAREGCTYISITRRVIHSTNTKDIFATWRRIDCSSSAWTLSGTHTLSLHHFPQQTQEDNQDVHD